MPVSQLNNVATQDTYVDSRTVVFPFPKPGFQIQVYNATVFYKLAVVGTSDQQRDISWEMNEHQMGISFTNFSNPETEGFGPDKRFAGIQVRSAVVGSPANITVI